MKYSIATVAGLVLASLIYSSHDAQAQSKEQIAIQNVQREMYDLRRAIEASKQGQDDRFAQMDSLIQQAVDATHALSTELAQIQKSMTQSVTEQQSRVSEPLAVMQTNLNQISQDSGAVRTSVENLTSRMTKMEAQLGEMQDLLRTMNAPPAAPPPPVGAPGNGLLGGPVGGLAEADSLLLGAQRDYAVGTYDLALKGFYDFASKYPDDPRAPEALYYIGLIYDSNKQYDDAVKAFDQIVERYGDVPKAADARFSKANALMKAGKKAEALKEFQDYVAKYPTDANAANARARITELRGR